MAQPPAISPALFSMISPPPSDGLYRDERSSSPLTALFDDGRRAATPPLFHAFTQRFRLQ